MPSSIQRLPREVQGQSGGNRDIRKGDYPTGQFAEYTQQREKGRPVKEKWYLTGGVKEETAGLRWVVADPRDIIVEDFAGLGAESKEARNKSHG